ncbi:hypothetical protein IIW29_00805, partial [Candidatus Saccharibacteria bacterium]|nr:hypothetical protein [Candidatus Saccharibacteria bacterium]
TQTVNITVGARLLIIALSVASLGFWVSNVLAIKDRLKVVKTLKIIAAICEVVVVMSVIILACAWPITFDQNTFKWVQLFALTGSGFFVMALAAWIISITHKDFEVVSIEDNIQDKKSETEVKEKESIAEVDKNEKIALPGEKPRIEKEEKTMAQVSEDLEKNAVR